MKLSDIGEKAFINRVLDLIPEDSRIIGGVGHDAALVDLRLQDDEALSFKIDRAAQPMAARRGWSSYEMWGRLAVTTVCSDLLCAGSRPAAFMLGCIFPPNFSVDQAEAVIRGASDECARNGVAFAGGDTKEGPSAEVVGTGVGVAKKREFLTRTGAKPGHYIVLAGALGGYLGAFLQIEQSELAGQDPNPAWVHYVSNPRAQWESASAMRLSGAAISGMDCSDGLYDALRVLSGAFGCELRREALPLHKFAVECAGQFGVDTLSLALGVGDWNIVYIVPQECEDELHVALQDPNLCVIGRVTEKPGIRVFDTDGVHGLRPVVNEHFVDRQEDEKGLLSKSARSPYDD